MDVICMAVTPERLASTVVPIVVRKETQHIGNQRTDPNHEERVDLLVLLPT
jgi:hypothetical protein